MMKLNKKIIVISGASEGIGKQIALKIAPTGANLVLIARSKDNLAKVAKQIKDLGGQANIYPCDIRDSDNVIQTVKEIIKDFGQIDVLINNAGIWHKMLSLDKLDDAVIHDIITTNLTSAIYLTKTCLPYLKRQQESAIINIVSKSGVVAQKRQSVYSASKYGLRGFTEALKQDLKGTNVKVAGIYPSGINTNIFIKAGEKNVPADLFINPSDLADAVLYILTRPKNIWIYDMRLEY